jgi:glutamate 5-kinase
MKPENHTNPLSNAKRIVVKIGSALITDEKNATLNHDWLASVAADIAALKKEGKQVLVVSSGAVALGRRILKYGNKKLELAERQASAAAGQIHLMNGWADSLAAHKIGAAQLLLTYDDTEQRKRFLNARNTLDTLLREGIVPIVNENDTVATAELRVGDNDRLAARVAQMVNAGLLVLLSDIDGLYTADPRKDRAAEHIPLVTEISADIEGMAGSARSATSTGGMRTKIEAAKIATAGGCSMVICEGAVRHPLKALAKGATHTFFLGHEAALSARKHWIVGTLEPQGSIVVDDGAAKALKSGKSLLPSGVCAVAGEFARGDAVWIETTKNKRIAKGLCSYNSEDAERIKGHKSEEIKKLLGYKARDVLIHRDDMVLL